jgi:hypothetical protein
MSAAFNRLARLKATLKRAKLTNGVSGAPQLVDDGIFVTPIDPISSETQRRLKLESGFEMYECYCGDGEDIRKGDVMIVSATSYVVHAAETWQFLNGEYLKIILEKAAPTN